MNTRCFEVDGYGDRADIALANDIAQGIKMDNFHRDQMRSLFLPDKETSSTATPITKIILNMIERGKASSAMWAENVTWDVGDIHEAVEDACTLLGLDSEEFSPYLLDKGNQIEIYLYAS